MDDSKETRIAGLVQELIGAQMTSKIVEECWGLMRPELKAKIADAMGAKFLVLATTDDWTVKGILVEEFKRRSTVPDSLNIDVAVQAAINKAWPHAIEAVANQALEKALATVREKFDPQRRGY